MFLYNWEKELANTKLTFDCKNTEEELKKKKKQEQIGRNHTSMACCIYLQTTYLHSRTDFSGSYTNRKDEWILSDKCYVILSSRSPKNQE